MQKQKRFISLALTTLCLVLIEIASFHWTGCEKQGSGQPVMITFVNNSGIAVHMWVGSEGCTEGNKLQPGANRLESPEILDFIGKADFSVGLNGQTILMKELSWPRWDKKDESITVIYNGTSLVAQ